MKSLRRGELILVRAAGYKTLRLTPFGRTLGVTQTVTGARGANRFVSTNRLSKNHPSHLNLPDPQTRKSGSFPPLFPHPLQDA